MTRLGAIAGCILLLAGCRKASTPPPIGPNTFGVVWTPVEDKASLSPGECLSWRCAALGDGALGRNQRGDLLLWFTTMGIASGADGGFVANGPVQGRAVALASSRPDVEFKFSPDAPVTGVGAEGTWDRYIETPSVLFDPVLNRWTQWYLGYRDKGGVSGFVGSAIGQRVSLDPEGVVWQPHGTMIYQPAAGAWDSGLVTGPTVTRGPDGWLHLYFVGVGTEDGHLTAKGSGVGHLSSMDGQRWDPDPANPVMLFGGALDWDQTVFEPCVRYLRGTFWMWYLGYRGVADTTDSISIGLATSSDGVNWTRHPSNPILSPGPAGAWDDFQVASPDVLEELDGSLLMVAHGTRRTMRTLTSLGLWRSR